MRRKFRNVSMIRCEITKHPLGAEVGDITHCVLDFFDDQGQPRHSEPVPVSAIHFEGETRPADMLDFSTIQEAGKITPGGRDGPFSELLSVHLRRRKGRDLPSCQHEGTGLTCGHE